MASFLLMNILLFILICVKLVIVCVLCNDFTKLLIKQNDSRKNGNNALGKSPIEKMNKTKASSPKEGIYLRYTGVSLTVYKGLFYNSIMWEKET